MSESVQFVVGKSYRSFVLMSGLDVRKTSNGKDFLSGLLRINTGSEAQPVVLSQRFVCFESKIAEFVQDNQLKKIIADVTFEPQDTYPWKITKITAFYREEDAKTLWDILDTDSIQVDRPAFEGLGQSLLSPKGYEVFRGILDGLGERIWSAYASQEGGNHDGVKGGLINHIRKLFRYTEIALSEWSDVLSENERDLIVLGIFVHDIGKMLEIEDGVYTEQSILSHNYLGIRVLDEFKPLIVERYSDSFYDELCAIILEHHGAFGERPKTIYVYIVHLIDNLDSNLSRMWTKVKSQLALGNDKIVLTERDTSGEEFKLRFNRY